MKKCMMAWAVICCLSAHAEKKDSPRTNKIISTRQLGIKGDGKTDVTAALNHANAYAVARSCILKIEPGVYIINPDAGGIMLLNHMRWMGDSANTILQARAYGSHGKSLLQYYSTAASLHDVYLQGIQFRGGQLFAHHNFAKNNKVPDTAQAMISITGAHHIAIKHCAFRNGGTQSAIFLYNVQHAHIEDNSFTSIGGMCISTYYCLWNRFIYVERNTGWSWGNRDRYDANAPEGFARLRFGDDFYECGGSNNYIRHNILWNKMKTRWFWLEARVHGYNEVNFNHLHMEGMNTFGTSYGNDYTKPHLLAIGNIMTGNTEEDCYFDAHTAADSAEGRSKYYASNLKEFGGLEYFIMRNNHLMSPHFTLARHMRHNNFSNTIYSPNSNTDTDGTGAQVLYQIGTGREDTIYHTTITDHIRMHDGELFRTMQGGDIVQELSISVSAEWDGAMIIGEFYAAEGGVNPSGIHIAKSRFAGKLGYAFYTGTAYPLKIDFTENHLEQTNIDPHRNLCRNTGQAAAIIDHQGCFFRKN